MSHGDPIAENLQSKDCQLTRAIEDSFYDILAEFGLETNRRLKSRIVLLSQTSSGGPTRNRVRNACEFFVKLREI